MITITWFNKKKSSLLLSVDGDWNFDDLIQAIEESKKIADQYSHSVNAIVDITQASNKNFFEGNGLKNISHIESMFNEESKVRNVSSEPGDVMIVVKNDLIKAAIDMFLSRNGLVGLSIFTASSLEEVRDSSRW